LNAIGEDDLSLMRTFCRGIKACVCAPLSLAAVQLHLVKYLTKLEQLVINKPFECPSAVVRSPPFGQCMMAIYVVVRPSFYAAKGKTAAGELGEAWQP
jgi:hypothetical protein